MIQFVKKIRLINSFGKNRVVETSECYKTLGNIYIIHTLGERRENVSDTGDSDQVIFNRIVFGAIENRGTQCSNLSINHMIY